MEKKENGRQRIIFDGTAFYEIDLECVEQKRKDQEKREKERNPQTKGAHYKRPQGPGMISIHIRIRHSLTGAKQQ